MKPRGLLAAFGLRSFSPSLSVVLALCTAPSSLSIDRFATYRSIDSPLIRMQTRLNPPPLQPCDFVGPRLRRSSLGDRWLEQTGLRQEQHEQYILKLRGMRMANEWGREEEGRTKVLAPVHTPPKPDSARRCQALWLAWAEAEADTDTDTNSEAEADTDTGPLPSNRTPEASPNLSLFLS